MKKSKMRKEARPSPKNLTKSKLNSSKPRRSNSPQTAEQAVIEAQPKLHTANARRKARKRARRMAVGSATAKDASMGVTPVVRGDGDVEKIAASQDGRQSATGQKAMKIACSPTKTKANDAKAAFDSARVAPRKKKRRKLEFGSKEPTAIQLPKPEPPASGPGLAGSTNWAALKAAIGAGKAKDTNHKGSLPPDVARKAAQPKPVGPNSAPTKLLAMDCEMVGVGPDGARSSLARVCIVNSQGNVLMDKFVRQKEKVTDFRTKYSGIRAADLQEHSSVPLEEIQQEVAALIKGRILVGHALYNDLRALMLSHPRKMIRDTARFPPLMTSAGPGQKSKSRALRHLALEVLGLGIQEGEHSPAEDARAALYLYQRHAKEWEQSIQDRSFHQLRAAPAIPPGGKSFAELAANDVMVDL